MVFVLEKLISLVAPHTCLACGQEGSLVCSWCLPDFALPVPSRCYRCSAATSDSRVCQKCRRVSRLYHVWVRATYSGLVKQLVHDCKFERKQAAALPMAKLMSQSLPYLDRTTTITHIPTATSRVRTRGYDHAKLVAQALAAELNLPHKTLLARTTQVRQVGAKRAQRLQQMQDAFRMVDHVSLPKQVVLVDDLVTTGATLEAAAVCLKKNGVKTVSAAVFAQKM